MTESTYDKRVISIVSENFRDDSITRNELNAKTVALNVRSGLEMKGTLDLHIFAERF